MIMSVKRYNIKFSTGIKLITYIHSGSVVEDIKVNFHLSGQDVISSDLTLNHFYRQFPFLSEMTNLI